MSTNYEDRGRRYNNDDDYDRGRPSQGRGGPRGRFRRRRICRFCIEKGTPHIPIILDTHRV